MVQPIGFMYELDGLQKLGLMFIIAPSCLRGLPNCLTAFLEWALLLLPALALLGDGQVSHLLQTF